MQNKPRFAEPKQANIPLIARWFLPTVGNTTFLLLIYFLLRDACSFLHDGDTGVHIRTGDIILQTGSIPRVDPFSFTMTGHEWFAWEWLADIIMSLIHKMSGLPGIVGVASIVVCVVFMLLYRRILARDCGPFTAFFLTMFAAMVSGVHWLARPHLASWIFLSLASIILESYRRRRSRGIYLLPFLVAVWANLHGAFVIIFPMLAVYAVGEAIETKCSKDIGVRNTRSVLKPYLLTGIFSAISSLATPFGWLLHVHIWRYVNDTALLGIIDEFQSPDFHTYLGKLVEIIVFLSIVTIVQAARKKRWIDIGLLALFIHLMLQSIRHIPLTVIITFPIIAGNLNELLREFTNDIAGTKSVGGRLILNLKNLAQNSIAVNRRLSGYGFYLIPSILLLFIFFSPLGNRVLDVKLDPEFHPVEAAKFMQSQDLQGNVYAPDEYGDYLIYRFYPKIRVFVDGRSDFYNSGYTLRDYQKLVKLDPSWPEVLDDNGVDWMLLYDDDPLGMIARMSGSWERVYRDDYSQILVKKPISGNK